MLINKYNISTYLVKGQDATIPQKEFVWLNLGLPVPSFLPFLAWGVAYLRPQADQAQLSQLQHSAFWLSGFYFVPLHEKTSLCYPNLKPKNKV